MDLSRFIPVDKSSAVRAFTFSLLTGSDVVIHIDGDLPEDVLSASKSLELFGKSLERDGGTFSVRGTASKPVCPVDCGNSATLFHILMAVGLHFGWDLELMGDNSLMSRDHTVFYEASKLYRGGFVETSLARESAQLKTFHLIAMLDHGGILHFKRRTRRNTEELLKIMGAELEEGENCLKILPVSKLGGYDLRLSGDPSAAFIAACAAIICKVPFDIGGIYGEDLRLRPFDILRNLGYDLKISREGGTVSVSGLSKISKKAGTLKLSDGDVPEIIDEIPFIAFMAARAGTKFVLHGASWLRNKESDRISESVRRFEPFFKSCEYDDGFEIAEKISNKYTGLPHSDDHRMEMLSKLVALDYGVPFEADGSCAVSFPEFNGLIKELEKMYNKIQELRAELDEVDSKLASLLKRRVEIGRSIVAVKRSEGLPADDFAREAAVLDRLSAENPEIAPLLRELYGRIFSWVKTQ
ncbi:chorismate mutase [bacterium]|nr:chorismate mutase [bacterium]